MLVWLILDSTLVWLISDFTLAWLISDFTLAWLISDFTLIWLISDFRFHAWLLFWALLLKYEFETLLLKYEFEIWNVHDIFYVLSLFYDLPCDLCLVLCFMICLVTYPCVKTWFMERVHYITCRHLNQYGDCRKHYIKLPDKVLWLLPMLVYNSHNF